MQSKLVYYAPMNCDLELDCKTIMSEYMEQLTIDLGKAFEVRKMDMSKPCRSGYVRVVKFLDDKKHGRPQMYEGNILDRLNDGCF